MVQVGGFRVVVRIAILSYRHFERSREIFLADRWRSMFEARKTQDEGVDEGVVSLQGHVGCQPQCKKDPSASLGMTVLGERIGSQGWCAAFLEDGILVSQPSPLGEGAPKGRIGHRRYEREWDEDRKLLIKGRKQSFTWLVLFTLLSFGSRFKVQG